MITHLFRNIIRIISIGLIFIGIFTSCASFKHNYPTGNFHFMVFSDVHISNDESKDKRLAEMVERINSGEFPDVKFLIFTGDNVSSFYQRRDNGDGFVNNRAAKFVSILKPLKIPYYIVLGNHDYKLDHNVDSDAPFSFNQIDTMEILWKKFANLKPYYAVDYSGWKFVILNSMRGRYLDRSFDDEQLKWFKTQLEENKPTLLFFHHPVRTDKLHLWCKPGGTITRDEEPDFFSLIDKYKNNIKGIFVGHGHMWVSGKLDQTIPVCETNSFGESTIYPFYLIGINIKNDSIDISRSPIDFDE